MPALREWLGARAQRVVWDADMRARTWFKIGGAAEAWFSATSEDEIAEAIALCDEEDVPWTVVGNGSNLLVKDGGIPGLTINTALMNAVSVAGMTVFAQAGALLAAAATAALNAQLGDFTWASGIPGSVGGAVYMNAGAYGGQIAGVFLSARVLRSSGGAIITMTRADMDFGYRHSALCGTRDIVLSAAFELKHMDGQHLRDSTRELNRLRRLKQPVDMPSAGSTFKRPVSGFAAAMIDAAGLKGLAIGGAEVSRKHAGFIVNTGGATAGDVTTLIERVRDAVFLYSGVTLDTEVVIVGEDAQIRKRIK